MICFGSICIVFLLFRCGCLLNSTEWVMKLYRDVCPYSFRQMFLRSTTMGTLTALCGSATLPRNSQASEPGVHVRRLQASKLERHRCCVWALQIRWRYMVSRLTGLKFRRKNKPASVWVSNTCHIQLSHSRIGVYSRGSPQGERRG
jgi:hypothetical protein